MKKFYVFLFFLFGLNLLLAQEPVFVNEDNMWHEQSCCLNSSGNACKQIRYTFQDTVQENGKVYRRLYQSFAPNYDTFEFADALYREDSIGKVYRLDLIANEEIMIYDFSLKLNDTIRLGNEIYFVMKVIAIDSIDLNSGVKRKRMTMKFVAFGNENEYNTTEDGAEVFWIEGIGSLLSPMNTFYMFPIVQCSYDLACYFNNGALEYETEKCDLSGEFKPVFVTEENMWHEATCCVDSMIICGLTRFIFRDTVQRDDKVYYKLYQAFPPNYDDLQFTEALYREDSTGKVYRLGLFPDEYDEEHLIYDFGADVGDTVIIGNEYTSLVVTNIDSIALNSSAKRKRMELKTIGNFGNKTVFWIEGIGDTSWSALNPFIVTVAGCYINLACYHYQGILEYETARCDLRTATNEVKLLSNVRIFPNPFANEIFIETETADNYTIRLYDAVGRLIKNQNFSGFIIKVNTSELPAGTYYIQITNKNGAYKIDKVLKIK